ncbi:MAG: hypothetical protein RI947_627 [Candidatus Parcubacteria bacterium]|jgi:excinuclease ABC subunit C
MEGFEKHSVPATREGLQSVSSTNGIYIFIGKGHVMYIGKSVNLKARLISHFENAKIDNKEAAIIQHSDTIEYIITDSELKALLLESELIQTHKPKYNARWMDDKSYIYVKVTVKDRYPKIYPVRREKDGVSQYFGPFPSIRSIEELLREIRRVFPFCTQKKLGKKPCFYSKIGLCNPCPSAIEQIEDEEERKKLTKQYRYNLRQIIRIFKGETDLVLKTLYKELKDLTKTESYEEALELRNRIFTMEHLIHDRLFVADVTQNYNQSDESTARLIALLKQYFPNLSSIKRVECYDISNFQQKDITASMVVFNEGIIDKKEYRRFKIKNEQIQSDFDAMDEVFRRRFRQSWQSPDLIVVDGGRPQVKRVLEVLDEIQVNIPLIGIAKHPDRLVIGIQGLPVNKPPVHNLGFNMIRSLRDESHRFAKKYHVLLRNKHLNII